MKLEIFLPPIVGSRKKEVKLNLRPRFLLIGGWKTKYTTWYNVPSYEYLYISGNEFILNMRLINHILYDMIINGC